MFGQLWVPFARGLPEADGRVGAEAFGVVAADGSGLAALTIATPPTASRPPARSIVAMTRRRPEPARPDREASRGDAAQGGSVGGTSAGAEPLGKVPAGGAPPDASDSGKSTDCI
jgi:hypothetical protein